MGTICPATHPTSVIALHGDADPLVPYGGGDMFGYPLGMQSVEARVGDAAKLADCGPDPKQTNPSDDSTRFEWSCPAGYGMELYTIKGGGHTWPGVTTYVDPSTTRRDGPSGTEQSPYDIETIVGHQTTEIVATELMLDFFDEHTRAGGT
jgi:polyhydroxybutyrate depolymerase